MNGQSGNVKEHRAVRLWSTHRIRVRYCLGRTLLVLCTWWMFIPSTRLIFFIFFSRSSSLESAIFVCYRRRDAFFRFVPPSLSPDPCCVLPGSFCGGQQGV